MPVDESSDEMEVSSKDSNDSGDSSPGDPSTRRNQAGPPRRQGAPGSRALLSHTLAGPSSRHSVPTSASETTERGGSLLGESPPNEEHVGESPPNEEHVGESPPNEEHVGESPPNEAKAGGQHPNAERSEPLDRRVSKYASNAHKILLSVFEEMMEWHDAKGFCREFLRCFESIQRFEDLLYVIKRLEFYIDQMRTFLLAKYSCMSPEDSLEMGIQNRFFNLFKIVVSGICLTLSADNSQCFKSIMGHYQDLQSLFSEYLEFWRGKDINQEDEVSRNKVKCLKKITEKHLLQTLNAFRQLLIHVGENCENVSVFEEGVSKVDLMYLRRKIVNIENLSSDESGSRESSSEEADS